MSDMDMSPDTRVSVSLAQLRAELVAMELRIVDRLNGALANKADRAILEQVVARQNDGLARLTIIEREAVRRDGPIVHETSAEIAEIHTRLSNLSEVARYKRWLWAQTVALIGIALPLVGFVIAHLTGMQG